MASTKRKTAIDTIMESRQSLVDYLVKKIEEDKQLPWENPNYDSAGFDNYNPISGTQYHGVNNLRLYIAMLQKGYSDPRWVTFHQIKDKEEYKLRKEESGTVVEFYKTIKKDSEEYEEYTKNWSEERKEKQKDDIYIYKYYYVFNAEQFEHFPELEKDPHKPLIITEEEKNQALEQLIQKSEAPIIYDQINKNFYKPSEDKIHLSKKENFKSLDQYYATAIHEIAHSTGHSSRLNRDGFQKLENGISISQAMRAEEELVAEFSSALIDQKYGIGKSIEHVDNHAAYLQAWSSAIKKDPNIIFRAIKEADKAVQYIEKDLVIEKTNSLEAVILEEDFSNEYWVVEGHERDENIPNYTGKHVTPELLQEIRDLDTYLYQKYCNGEHVGFYKFYFDHIKDGQVIEHGRVDIGDGQEANQYYFDELAYEIDKLALLKRNERDLKEETPCNEEARHFYKENFDILDLKDKAQMEAFEKRNSKRIPLTSVDQLKHFYGHYYIDGKAFLEKDYNEKTKKITFYENDLHIGDKYTYKIKSKGVPLRGEEILISDIQVEAGILEQCMDEAAYLQDLESNTNNKNQICDEKFKEILEKNSVKANDIIRCSTRDYRLITAIQQTGNEYSCSYKKFKDIHLKNFVEQGIAKLNKLEIARTRSAILTTAPLNKNKDRKKDISTSLSL